MKPPSSDPHTSLPGPIALIGAGAVATALARALNGRVELGLWARDRAAARRAVAGAPTRVADELADLAGARLLLICVSDPALEQVAERLAAELEVPAGAVALHTSGYHSASVLGPLARRGWSTGGIHPLVSFPASGGGERDLVGAWFTVTGAREARAAAAAIVAAFGGRELGLDESGGARSRYHAAAALVAGGVVALVDLAADAVADSAPPGEVREAFARLGAGVLANAARTGPSGALTGPVARGDAELVARHLDALEPEARAAYTTLLSRMLLLARQRELDPVALTALQRLADR